MSISLGNDKLLYEAAESGDHAKVKELLSKGIAGTDYRNVVSQLIIRLFTNVNVLFMSTDDIAIDDNEHNNHFF